MDESFLSEDVYFIIAKHCDYSTLLDMEKVNNLLSHISFRERKKRLKSIYPFGEEKARIKIVLKDSIVVEKVICILPSNSNPNANSNHEIFIPPEKYAMYYVAEVLRTWFFYNFSCKDWILTAKIFKSILRIMNKPVVKDMGDILIFDFKEGKSFLSEIS